MALILPQKFSMIKKIRNSLIFSISKNIHKDNGLLRSTICQMSYFHVLIKNAILKIKDKTLLSIPIRNRTELK
jgi:hypothetical protein